MRAAAGIAGPVGAGLAAGQLQLGVLVAIGALPPTLAAVAGSYRDRARRMSLAAAAGGVGYFLGHLAGQGWGAALLIVLLAMVSALISSYSNNASLAGLQLLVFGIVGTGTAGAVAPGAALGYFAIGAGWVLLLNVAAWPVRGAAPERSMIATVLVALSGLLTAGGTEEAEPARLRLTTALNAAYDALLSARSRVGGRSGTYRRLLLVLRSTTPMVEAGVALTTAGSRPPRRMVTAVDELAVAVRTGTRVEALELPEVSAPSLRALREGLCGLQRLLAGEGGAAEPETSRAPRAHLRLRLGRRLDAARVGRATWVFAVRLAFCEAVALGVVTVLGLERPYWVMLTVAVVLKPDFGSVFARGVLRGGGTIAGAAIGAGILSSAPPGWGLVLLIAAIAFLLPAGQARHYGMFATFITPLVIILLDLAQEGSWSLLVDRLLDTLLGCGVVLILGFLAWPGSRKPRVGGQLASGIDALAEYTAAALTLDRDDPASVRYTLRRRCYRRLSDLRTEFQRLLAEPSAAGRQAAGWWPAIVGLERCTDAVTALAVEIRAGREPPPRHAVDATVAATRGLSRAVRERLPPADPELPDCAALEHVTTELRSVHRVLRRPDPEGRRAGRFSARGARIHPMV
jgi:uncharacterized membrane protein YccC